MQEGEQRQQTLDPEIDIGSGISLSDNGKKYGLSERKEDAVEGEGRLERSKEGVGSDQRLEFFSNREEVEEEEMT